MPPSGNSYSGTYYMGECLSASFRELLLRDLLYGRKPWCLLQGTPTQGPTIWEKAVVPKFFRELLLRDLLYGRMP